MLKRLTLTCTLVLLAHAASADPQAHRAAAEKRAVVETLTLRPRPPFLADVKPAVLADDENVPTFLRGAADDPAGLTARVVVHALGGGQAFVSLGRCRQVGRLGIVLVLEELVGDRVVLVPLVKSRLAKLVWALWPAWVWFTVMATGNHFWLDIAAGVLLAGATVAVMAYVERRLADRDDVYGRAAVS